MYERYQEIRDSLGYRDVDVVKGAGVPFTTLSEWKSGKSNPNAIKLYKIAQFLNVDVGYILGLTDDKTPVRDVIIQEAELDPKTKKFREIASVLSDSDVAKLMELAELLTLKNQQTKGGKKNA